MVTPVVEFDRRLLAALEPGLALETRPYARLADALGTTEERVLERLAVLQADGTISRFGVVVRHHELGYRANAMVVWQVPKSDVAAAGQTLTALPFVRLCYARRAQPPRWPYNLYCMIHGRDRALVDRQIEEATVAADLQGRPRKVLFSKRRFKQRGARYSAPPPANQEATHVRHIG